MSDTWRTTGFYNQVIWHKLVPIRYPRIGKVKIFVRLTKFMVFFISCEGSNDPTVACVMKTLSYRLLWFHPSMYYMRVLFRQHVRCGFCLYKLFLRDKLFYFKGSVTQICHYFLSICILFVCLNDFSKVTIKICCFPLLFMSLTLKIVWYFDARCNKLSMVKVFSSFYQTSSLYHLK